MGCRTLLQGIFPTQGLNPHLLCPLHWQTGSLPLELPGKPHLAQSRLLINRSKPLEILDVDTEGNQGGQGSWGAGGRAEPSLFPILTLRHHLETTLRPDVSGLQEPEGRTFSHWKLYWGLWERRRETQLTVTTSNQMPDAAKAQRLNWGLVAELYQRAALVASLKAGKFSMQVQWPFVKWPRNWLDPKEHCAPSWTLQPSPHLPHFLPRATRVHIPSPLSPSSYPYPGVIATGDRWPKICTHLYGVPCLGLSKCPCITFLPRKEERSELGLNFHQCV